MKTAIVTGGSAGIGEATVRRLHHDGFRVITGARRIDKLRQITDPLTHATAFPLDVTSSESIDRFVADALAEAGDDGVGVLVNNAGAALGLESVAEAREDLWQRMFELNVMGVLRMTKAFLPQLIASGDGHILNVGSIAGFETYPGGGGYTASKHALRAVTRTLRIELLGQPVRVTEVSPGLVETEFSLVRFENDAERAEGVYSGMQPLTGEDIADCIAWAVTRPSHVNIDEILVRPRAQATATTVFREPVFREPVLQEPSD